MRIHLPLYSQPWWSQQVTWISWSPEFLIQICSRKWFSHLNPCCADTATQQVDKLTRYGYRCRWPKIHGYYDEQIQGMKWRTPHSEKTHGSSHYLTSTLFRSQELRNKMRVFIILLVLNLKKTSRQYLQRCPIRDSSKYDWDQFLECISIFLKTAKNCSKNLAPNLKISALSIAHANLKKKKTYCCTAPAFFPPPCVPPDQKAAPAFSSPRIQRDHTLFP